MAKFCEPSLTASNPDTFQLERVKSERGSSSTIVKALTKKKNKKNSKKAFRPSTGPSAGQASDQVLVPKDTADKVKCGRVQKRLKSKRSKIWTNIFSQLREVCLDMLGRANSATLTTAASSTGSLAARLQSQLKGAYRYINEQLYPMESADSEERYDSDPFSNYLVGYQQPVDVCPLNPLDRIIKVLLKLPRSHVIGDFGCGKGKLARSVPHKVYSMDLVSCREDIIACDMSSTPLPSQSLDVAVYCLSLMGTNLKKYLLEANRVLKINGSVYIAEIKSHFDDIKSFKRGVRACGFNFINRDLGVDLFYIFQFKKVRNVGRLKILPPFSLKACSYRKR